MLSVSCLWLEPTDMIDRNDFVSSLVLYQASLSTDPRPIAPGGNPSYLNSIYQEVFFLKILLNYFRERGKEKEREGKKHRCLRETSISCLLHVPQPGTMPTTQACALTRN